jgi:uncharacterized protein YheU (UPF0270 family)
MRQGLRNFIYYVVTREGYKYGGHGQEMFATTPTNTHGRLFSQHFVLFRQVRRSVILWAYE